MLAVKDLNQRLGLKLAEDGSYTTIAGYLLASAGRLLESGERVEDAVGVFQVERVEKRRISRVRFTPAAERDDRATTSQALLAFLAFPSLTVQTVLTLDTFPVNIFL
jgi:Mg2+/Co2+ transporter CorC